MAKRDPHDVLGVRVGADSGEIKAAWRRLARGNHPDLTGDDPAASRAATVGAHKRTVAPKRRTFACFTAEALSGITTHAGIPRRCAA